MNREARTRLVLILISYDSSHPHPSHFSFFMLLLHDFNEIKHKTVGILCDM
jgi:hypothetical protein